MKKIQLKVIGFFQPFPSDKSCYIVLREYSGKKKIVIRVGLQETDAILLALEDIRPLVPFIHDLFHNLAQMANVHLKEVVIDGYSMEKYTSQLIFTLDEHEIKVPARACD